MTKHIMLSVCLTAAALLPAVAEARTIVLTNDDGLTSNVKALYDALKAEGHDVIVSLPCSGQSGMGAAIKFMRPLGPLAADCLNGAAKAGEPGAGQATRQDLGPDFHYVDGTPVMALLYGLDVAAQARWGKAPELVLSGPNEGQNVGSIVISSGTVSNAQYGAIRGIPSIALSADFDTTGNAALANPKSQIVAKRSIDLIKALESRAGKGPLLPVGTALNVNFPQKLDGARWQFSRIGSYSSYDVRFSAAVGPNKLPAITIGANAAKPRPDQMQDESVVFQKDIAVSIMRIGYDHDPATQRWLARHLRGFLAGKGK